MKVSKEKAIKEDWENVKSLNYKLGKLQSKYQSIVYAKLSGKHGTVSTKDIERIYYIISGEGEFEIEGQITRVKQGDVLAIPPMKKYDYWPVAGKLEILLFMELWDN